MGINLDQGTLNAGGGVFGRQAVLGLKGNYGTVTAGRQYTQLFLAINEVMDPFKTGTAGRANNSGSIFPTRNMNDSAATMATPPATDGGMTKEPAVIANIKPVNEAVMMPARLEAKF
jgi:hypothetical protein